MSFPRGRTILSGIQPSGTLHVGNYLGALKQWVQLQRDNTTYYCIVDEHAITVPYEPAELPGRVLDAAALYVAAGLDPEASVIFVQSHVPAHTELAWLLSTVAQLGELRRMTQFKEKSTKHKEEASLGLFAYPVLQAADILLYQPDLVPVGEDQVQHIELTRDIAKRFNGRFGEVFRLPKAHLATQAARIMSLQDPGRKMSKSDPEKSYVALIDAPQAIRQKLMSAVTDTAPVISFEGSGPAVRNLLAIYEGFSDEPREAIEARFAGADYKTFKEALADLVVEKLAPVRERYQELRERDDELRVILGRGKERASAVANQTLHAVKQKMGLI